MSQFKKLLSLTRKVFALKFESVYLLVALLLAWPFIWAGALWAEDWLDYALERREEIRAERKEIVARLSELEREHEAKRP